MIYLHILLLFVVSRALMFPALTLPPLEVFIPCDGALPALISLQFHASPEVIRYLTTPSGFVDGTVYSLNLIPALLWNDVGQISCRKGLFRGYSWKISRRGKW